jgi:peptidoglycan/LPS O-acetylase OafA/YrhL
MYSLRFLFYFLVNVSIIFYRLPHRQSCLSLLSYQYFSVIVCIGMIYAAILGCRAYRNFVHEVTLKRLVVDAGAFIVAMTVCNVISFGYFKHPNITMNQSIYPWIAAPILFLLVSALPGVRQSKIVNSPILGSLGAVSFSTYLLHPFAITFAAAYVPSEFSLIVSIGLSLVFSIVGYRLVELPGQARGKRIITAVL